MLTVLIALAMVAPGCESDPSGAQAEELLGEARKALDSVESFRMDTQFAAPLPGSGSGQVTSLTVVWASPETILTIARGEGDPPFQEVYQQGETCLARYSENGQWEWLGAGCAEPGQIRPTFRAWLDIEEPEVIAETDGTVTVRGKAVDSDDDGEDEPPLVGTWELQIDTEMFLITSAAGYARDETTLLIDTAITDYNAEFDAVFNSLGLPDGV